MFRSKLYLLIAEKEQLDRRKLTQRIVANESGVSTNTICKWMKRDLTMPRVDGETALALCRYFGCTLTDLVEFDY
jgi:DNA-binding Xre family transcriptional regulator